MSFEQGLPRLSRLQVACDMACAAGHMAPACTAPHTPAIMRPLISTPPSITERPSTHTARYSRCLPRRRPSGARRLAERSAWPAGFRWNTRPARGGGRGAEATMSRTLRQRASLQGSGDPASPLPRRPQARRRGTPAVVAPGGWKSPAMAMKLCTAALPSTLAW